MRVLLLSRLLQDWTHRSAVIKCQSLITAISLVLRSAAQGIAYLKSKIFLAKLCFFGPWGSVLPPEEDCMKIGPLGVELSMFKDV